MAKNKNLENFSGGCGRLPHPHEKFKIWKWRKKKNFFFRGGWKVTYLLWYSSHTGFLPNRISPTQDPSHRIPPTWDPSYCIPPTWVHFTKKHFPFFSVIYLKENQDFIFKILFPNYFQIFYINCPLKILKI